MSTNITTQIANMSVCDLIIQLQALCATVTAKGYLEAQPQFVAMGDGETLSIGVSMRHPLEKEPGYSWNRMLSTTVRTALAVPEEKWTPGYPELEKLWQEVNALPSLGEMKNAKLIRTLEKARALSEDMGIDEVCSAVNTLLNGQWIERQLTHTPNPPPAVPVSSPRSDEPF